MQSRNLIKDLSPDLPSELRFSRDDDFIIGSVNDNLSKNLSKYLVRRFDRLNVTRLLLSHSKRNIKSESNVAARVINT